MGGQQREKHQEAGLRETPRDSNRAHPAIQACPVQSPCSLSHTSHLPARNKNEAQAICCTTQRRCRSVSMLCDLYSTSCCNKGRCCRNIKALRIISTSSYNFKQLHSRFNLCCMFPHCCCTTSNLIGGLRSCTLCR